MKERERLIELLGKDYILYEKEDIEELADILLENGVIVPPCKVGDIVYDIHNGMIFGGKIIMVSVFDGCLTFVATGGRYFSDDDIGKTVFLTREEAEAKLKGGTEE